MESLEMCSFYNVGNLKTFQTIAMLVNKIEKQKNI